jgi:hypothetical protein
MNLLVKVLYGKCTVSSKQAKKYPKCNAAMILVLMSFALFFYSFSDKANTDEIAYFVSPAGNDDWSGKTTDRPFATIQRARNAIREIKIDGGLAQPVTVYLRGGIYELQETLVFKPEDSGTRESPIQYTAYNDEEPVISGSREITGPWEEYEGEIYVCTIEDVKKGKWYFRQLFLDDERQPRACIPDKGYYNIAETEDDLGKYGFRYRSK